MRGICFLSRTLFYHLESIHDTVPALSLRRHPSRQKVARMLDAASQVMLSASAYDEASVANAQDAVVQFAQLLDVRT